MRIGGIEVPEVIGDSIRACKPHLVSAALFSLLINLLFLAPAIYMLQVYDRVVATGGKLTLLFVTIALAVALMTLAALDAIRSRLLVRASARFDAMLSPKILDRMLSRGGRENVQAMRDVDTVRQTMSSPAAIALMDLPWAPLFILVCFMLHFWIGVLAIGSIAMLLTIAWRHQRATRSAIQQSSRSLSASHAAEQSASVHAETLRGLGMVGALVNKQLAQRSGGIADLAEAQFAGSRFTALSRFLRLFVQSAALGLGALLAIAGDLSAGGIIAGSILLGRALQPIDSLIGGWSALTSGRAAFERLSEVLAKPGDRDIERTVLPAPTGRVEVEQVSLRGSDGRTILMGVSFSANPGEILGIVGPSGSGKTSLAKILVGAIPATVGVVRIDGAQLSDWDPDRLGKYIGYLPQEPSLLEGTIKDNISRFEGWSATGDVDEAVIAAAQMAGVHELILKLPQGYDTELGAGGSGLSSGQAQRIALARAMYGDPTLFVLDEPNAFLDAEGEASLTRAIIALRDRGAAVLLVAHRRSILEIVDRLLVLEAGRPKMIGPAKDVVVRLGRREAESAA